MSKLPTTTTITFKVQKHQTKTQKLQLLDNEYGHTDNWYIVAIDKK